MIPHNINPLQWHQSVGLARQSCARIFRDGGAPEDALRAFGLETFDAGPTDWSKVVDLIADALSKVPERRAA